MARDDRDVYGITLKEPVLWQAGTVEDVPVYFDCEKCGDHDGHSDKKIAGFLSTEPEYRYGAIVTKDREGGRFVLALYCETCWPDVLARLSRPVKV